MAPSAIHISSGADSAYACPLAVLLRSIIRALPTGAPVHFHILDGGLTPSDRDRILAGLPAARTQVHWLRPRRKKLDRLPLWGRMHVATYDKLLLEELIDPAVDDLVWFDADTLVLRDPSELFEPVPSPHLVRAARDPLVPCVSAPFGVAAWRSLGLDPTLPYFNAGVLRIRLDGWRAADVARRSLAYLREHARDVYFWDQEGLNAVLSPAAGQLDETWNCRPDLAPADGTPALVHFSGNLKPWRTHGATRWHSLYNTILDETAWRTIRPPVPRLGLLARYQASALRNWTRPIEAQWMRWTRRRTLHLTSSTSENAA